MYNVRFEKFNYKNVITTFKINYLGNLFDIFIVVAI
jgi:hypothetical protein